MEDLFIQGAATRFNKQDPWYKQWWVRFIQPRCAIPAPKLLSLRDWRLGLASRIAQISILGYTAYSIILTQKYLMAETPTGIVSCIVTNDINLDNAILKEMQAVADGTETICCEPWQAKYHYEFSSPPDTPIKHNLSGCIARSANAMTVVKKSDAFAATTIRTQTVIRAAASPEAAAAMYCGANDFEVVDADGTPWLCEPPTGSTHSLYEPSYNVYWSPGDENQDVNFMGKQEGQINGTCVCERTTYAFVPGAEALNLELDHTYLLPQQMRSGSNVKTFVTIQQDGPASEFATLTPNWKKVFRVGERPHGTVAEWLEWAEVDLDLPANEGVNEQWLTGSDAFYQGPAGVAAGTYPYPRVSGLVVDVNMVYWDWNMAPIGVKEASVRNKDAPTICILSLRPHFLWTSEAVQPRSLSSLPEPFATRDYTEMHGVRLVWNSGGYLHHVDTGLLISAIIEGFVLVGTVGGMVELLARYAFGDKSAFYRSVIMEQVSITDEYARFAARMMVAAAFFDVADNDASGEMSKTELFEALRRVTITQSKVTVNDTISLMEFMMKIADDGLDIGNEAMEEDEEGKEGQEAESDGAGDISEDEEPTINREELVNTYCGPPCSVQSLLAIIKRKNRQGRYLIQDEDYEMYDKIDKQVAEELRKEKGRRDAGKIAERKAKEEGVAHIDDTEKEVDIRKLQKLIKRQRDDMAAARVLFEQSLQRLEKLRLDYPDYMPLPVQSNDADFVGLHGHRANGTGGKPKDSWFGFGSWLG